MRQFALAQVSSLLRRMAFQANRTGKLVNEESVHDLRVSIRRLDQCLTIFNQFLPRSRVKKLQRKMKAVMDLASEVRNRDVALSFLRQAKLPSGSPLVAVLQHERRQAGRRLARSLQRWSRRDFHKMWRARLGV